jgi:hypothetical protein
MLLAIKLIHQYEKLINIDIIYFKKANLKLINKGFNN